mgnify:CR=1 FL=1
MSFVRLPESPIRCKNLVGGAFVDVVTKDTIPVTSPWTGAVIGEVPMSRAADVDTAVALAKKASVGWAAVSVPSPSFTSMARASGEESSSSSPSSPAPSSVT